MALLHLTRICKTCGKKKPIQMFVRNDGCQLGVTPTCKACSAIRARPAARKRSAEQRKLFPEKVKALKARYYAKHKEKIQSRLSIYRQSNRERLKEAVRKRKYGLGSADFAAMLVSQDGCCAICQKTLSLDVGKSIHIDHCHVAGNVRGLLCSNCNTGLGLFRDSINNLRNAIQYLQNFQTQEISNG